MSSTLDLLRSKVLETLGDDGTRFSSSALDLGISQALALYSEANPLMGVYAFDAQAGPSQDLSGMPGSGSAVVLGVYWRSTFGVPSMLLATKPTIPVPYMLSGSGSSSVATIYPPGANEVRQGDEVRVVYRVPVGVDDLPYEDVDQVCRGAAGFAADMRAGALVEAFGGRPGDRESLQKWGFFVREEFKKWIVTRRSERNRQKIQPFTGASEYYYGKGWE